MTGPLIHPPGIYFGLPATIYHADPALGSTRIKAIAVDIFEAQFDELYGEDADTEALIFGSAVHVRMLEGRAAFEAQYCLEYDKRQDEGALVTMGDLRRFLLSLGQQGFTSRNKPDLIKMVQMIAPDQKIADVEKAKWEKLTEGKIPLKPKRWAQIEIASQWVQRDPLLGAVMEDGTFKAGAPEVSVFYEDRGRDGDKKPVRRKARFDRLLRHVIVDLKTFAPMFSGPIETTAVKTINRMRYDIQAADYLRAWQKAKDLHAAGLVFGEEPHNGFLAECFNRDAPGWIWVMVKSKGAPQPLVVDWKAQFAMGAATHQVEQAIENYIALRDRYGEHADWPPERPAMTLQDSNTPVWFAQ